MTRLRSFSPARAALLALACALALTGCTAAPKQRGLATGADDAARLFPDPAFANTRIAVVFAEPAPDPSRCRFEWRRNGTVISGATGHELEPSNFVRGDRVSVRVVSAAPAGARTEWFAQTQVANTPPSITRIGIAAETAATGLELRAHVECVDPDGDRPVFEYTWFRNGAPVDGVRDERLPAAAFTRGDRLQVTVVAKDGLEASKPTESEPYVFDNHPPAFSSRPAAPRPGDTVFEYHAVATDPDGDPLRYELVNAPAGMTLGTHGEVRWDLPRAGALRGDVPIRIRALDANGGEAVQEFTLTLGEPAAAAR